MYIYLNKNNSVNCISKTRLTQDAFNVKKEILINDTQLKKYKKLVFSRKEGFIIKFENNEFIYDNSLYIIMNKLRTKRNIVLSNTDKLVLIDNFNLLSDDDKNLLLDYRQRLRDITLSEDLELEVILNKINEL